MSSLIDAWCRFPTYLLLILIMTGCGKEAVEEAAYDNTEEVDAYYRDNPDRFAFASPEDIPDNLIWEDGNELTPFGDPRAERGGRLNLRLARMQPTLRILGPDSNGTLRGPLWSANTVYLIHQHPWEDGYIPGIAKRWSVDPDNRRRIFLELDPDARWSDGRPVTVEDMFFSLYMQLSPNINDPAINRVIGENFQRFTRYSDHLFSMTLTNPTPNPLSAAETFILNQREFYREFGEDYPDRYHWRFAPVTGPYTLDEKDIKRGEQITFRRIDDWWANDKPFYRHRFNPDALTFVVIRDDTKAFESFLRGIIDWHALNETDLWYDRADVEPIRKGYIERAWSYDLLPAPRSGMYLNAMQPLLDNPDVRTGIHHAINYQRVNDEIHRGDRRRIRSFADGFGPYDHPDLRAREFDLEKALERFAKAGFSERGPDGILQNAAGQRLSFTLTVSTQGEDVDIATVMKEEAMKAGLELRIEQMDPTSFFTKIFEKNHELALSSWDTGYSQLPAFQWEMRGEDAGKPKNFNTSNIKVKRLDDLLEEWDATDDPAEARRISHAIQQEIHDFAAWIPGLTIDFTRIGYWRWVRWPDYFQVPRYFFFMSTGVFWIDEDRRQETLEARKSGTTFEPVTRVYDRWKKADE
ncbi:MAG: ABC transporter substrate-binding protein [Puniceicoccaceae bacterium]